MILPPYLDRPRDSRPQGMRDEVLDHAYGDVRVPTGYGSGEDKSPARPFADHLRHRPGSGQTCDHRGRWDVLVAEAAERWDAEDKELPHEFRLVATCTGCGLVTGLEGQLTPSRWPRGPYDLAGPDDELRAKDIHGRELVAQRHSAHAGFGASWTVYRQRGDGRGLYAVGVLSAGETRRGRAYVAARYGHPNDDRTEATPVVEAPTAIGALRKLAKLDPPSTVPVSRYVPGDAASGYRGHFVNDLVPDPTTAEAAAATELALAIRRAELEAYAEDARRQLADRVVPLRPGLSA